jgi:hypothetical protein
LSFSWTESRCFLGNRWRRHCLRRLDSSRGSLLLCLPCRLLLLLLLHELRFRAGLGLQLHCRPLLRCCKGVTRGQLLLLLFCVLFASCRPQLNCRLCLFRLFCFCCQARPWTSPLLTLLLLPSRRSTLLAGGYAS